MNQIVHRFFVAFLLFAGLLTAAVIGLKNWDYYTTPIEERPFQERYDELKPSGLESHGYGIVGSAMIIVGVVMYSSRKRIRTLSHIGSIRYFLEFHIFLCLTGPLLVLYHTTFKFGGIVAVSFWSMAAVVGSGIVGRYLYVQIPRGIQGNELSIKELEEESSRMYNELTEKYGLTIQDIQRLDVLATPRQIRLSSVSSFLAFLAMSDITRRSKVQRVIHHLQGKAVSARMVGKIQHLAVERIKLLRRIRFLEQLKMIFYYWHVIHLPFSIIMFVILIVHVSVAIAFGYRWIF